MTPPTSWSDEELRAGLGTGHKRCLGLGPARFYADNPDDAIRVCLDCPVEKICREWAVRHEPHGVWGATTERDRRRIRKFRKIKEPE